jgi:hypothetical protein
MKRAFPYVCGAIGPWEPSRLQRLIAASPRASQIHSDENATLWSSSPLPSWRTDSGRGWFWSPLADGETPRSWASASERRLAAGLAIDGTAVTLHTCAIGVQDLYTTDVNGALYFATDIDPLLAVIDGSLHSDWSAWASILAIGGPLGPQTPFEEVRRMEAATGIRVDEGQRKVVSYTPAWLAVEPTGCEPAEIVDALRAHIPSARGLQRIAVTLSGGWDSRLLSALAAKRSRRPVLAWTTSIDDGLDHDVRLSRPVAAALGMKHRIFVQDADAYRTECLPVFERVQHQTQMHTCFMPLARRIARRSEPLLDGLAGEALLRGYDAAVVDATSAGAQRDALWTSLAIGDGRLVETWFAPGVAARLKEASRESFAAATRAFEGNPVAPRMSRLATRVARGTAQSPLRLFAPETDVRMPFLHPDVLTVVQRVPLAMTQDGTYYRRILDVAMGDGAGAMPSSNDPGTYDGGAKLPRRQRHPLALNEMVARITADDTVVALLGKELRPALDNVTERDQICQWNGPRLTLQWASMMAHWRAKYAHRLSS